MPDHMDLISEHFYVGQKPGPPRHVGQMPRRSVRNADAHREVPPTIPSLKGKEIPIALDEWNYWYGRTSSANSGRGTSSRTRWASPRDFTSMRARATSCSWPTTPRR